MGRECKSHRAIAEIDSAELQVDFEKLGKSTSADLAMSFARGVIRVSAEIFAGVQIALPMYDNGKTDKRVEMAEKNVSILKAK